MRHTIIQEGIKEENAWFVIPGALYWDEEVKVYSHTHFFGMATDIRREKDGRITAEIPFESPDWIEFRVKMISDEPIDHKSNVVVRAKIIEIFPYATPGFPRSFVDSSRANNRELNLSLLEESEKPLEIIAAAMNEKIIRDRIVLADGVDRISVRELIEMLQKVEKVLPDLEVGIYDPEFMVTQTIRFAVIEKELYSDKRGNDTKKIILTLS